MNTTPTGIAYQQALAALRSSSLPMRNDLPEQETLLCRFHPDYRPDARTRLPALTG